MAQLHFPRFPHFSRNLIFYVIAIIPASLIIYTVYTLVEALITGKITF